MKKWLLRVLVLGSLLSCPGRALDDLESWKILDLNILTQAILIDIEDFLNLSQTNSEWRHLTSIDSFWESMYWRLRGTTAKLHEKLSYKENYQKHVMPTVFFHLSVNCSLTISSDFILRNRVVFSEILTPGHMALEELNDMFTLALEKKPRVFCTCFGIGEGCKKALDLGLRDDVLMIVPVGHDGHAYGEKFSLDFQKNYPNVLWVAACKADGTIEPFSNYGALTEIAAPSLCTQKGTSQSALNLAELVSQLRALRPDLTAAEIRFLVIEAAEKTPESLQKIPQGGILNRQATIKAARDYRGMRPD